jgi:DNA polymerase-3 subunit delta
LTLTGGLWYYCTMALKTPGEFLKEISSGTFQPVYYFFGEDDYRIIEAEKYLASQFIPDLQLVTNYRRFDGKKTACADLLAELAVYPMLGEKQLVAVTNIQSFKKDDIERIFRMLTPPDPNRIVVLSSPADKAPNKKSAFYKNMVSELPAVEFNKLSDTETRRMVSRKLEKNNLSIEPAALGLLTELIAGNRGALEAETDKLINYMDGGGTVTSEDIRRVAAGYQVYTVFTLADHIIEGESRKVLQQIERLIADGDSPTGILYFLGLHFVSLYLVKNNRQLEPHRRWLTYRFRNQAEKYENEQLEDILIEIARTDADLRKGNIKPALALESLALKLTGEMQNQ